MSKKNNDKELSKSIFLALVAIGLTIVGIYWTNKNRFKPMIFELKLYTQQNWLFIYSISDKI